MTGAHHFSKRPSNCLDFSLTSVHDCSLLQILTGFFFQHLEHQDALLLTGPAFTSVVSTLDTQLRQVTGETWGFHMLAEMPAISGSLTAAAPAQVKVKPSRSSSPNAALCSCRHVRQLQSQSSKIAARASAEEFLQCESSGCSRT